RSGRPDGDVAGRRAQVEQVSGALGDVHVGVAAGGVGLHPAHPVRHPDLDVAAGRVRLHVAGTGQVEGHVAGRDVDVRGAAAQVARVHVARRRGGDHVAGDGGERDVAGGGLRGDRGVDVGHFDVAGADADVDLPGAAHGDVPGAVGTGD